MCCVSKAGHPKNGSAGLKIFWFGGLLFLSHDLAATNGMKCGLSGILCKLVFATDQNIYAIGLIFATETIKNVHWRIHLRITLFQLVENIYPNNSILLLLSNQAD